MRALARTAPPSRDRILQDYLGEARKALDLSFDQMGRVFSVNGETVRRWETGAVRMPEPHWARIGSLIQETRRLTKVFDPVRLPLVIRRPAPLFEGSSALDWILNGRIEEVADLYEATLYYQA